jgi:hypothetical protein
MIFIIIDVCGAQFGYTFACGNRRYSGTLWLSNIDKSGMQWIWNLLERLRADCYGVVDCSLCVVEYCILLR